MIRIISVIETSHTQQLLFLPSVLEPYTLASLTPLLWTFPRPLPADSPNVLSCLTYIAYPHKLLS